MLNWKTANECDLRRLQALSLFLSPRPHLFQYLFQRERPLLNDSPDKLIEAAGGFCSSDKVLIRVALQLWCEYGQMGISELFCLDGDVFLNVLEALKMLGPKTGPWDQILTFVENRKLSV